jgi:hypothetical protein
MFVVAVPIVLAAAHAVAASGGSATLGYVLYGVAGVALTAIVGMVGGYFRWLSKKHLLPSQISLNEAQGENYISQAT